MNKKLVLVLVAIGTLIGTSFAMYGQGQGRGLGMQITAEERAKLWSITDPVERAKYVQELRQKYGITQGQARQNMYYTPSTMVNQYSVSTLTENLKEDLINQYGEERMARDLYNYAYEKYGVQVFANIAKSEQQHMDALKVLLDRYNIEAPSDYAKDNDLYYTLKAKIDEGLEQALNVGVTVETVDIKDIAADVKDAYDAGAKDLVAVYTNIAGGSYNHLRGFLQVLKMYGYNLPDVSEYLPNGITVEQLLAMRGPQAKALFPEYVKEVYGIDLSGYILTNQNQQNMGQRGRWNQTNTNNTQTYSIQNQIQTRTTALNGNIPVAAQRYVNQVKVVQYKKLIEQKYKAKLDSFTQDKIQEIIKKIDDLLEKIVNSTTYTDTQKETYTNVLVALKEILLQKLNSGADSILNSLLGE